MVSIAGYSVGEYIFAIVLTYLLVVLCAVLWSVVFATKERNYGLPLGVGGVGFVVLQVLYMFDVRLATVAFINGALGMLCLFGIGALYIYYVGEQND